MRAVSQPCASRLGKMELIASLCTSPRRYLALNTVLALYVALVEKSTIYEGKRRTIASRVSRRDLSALLSTTASARTFCAHAVLWQFRQSPG